LKKHRKIWKDDVNEIIKHRRLKIEYRADYKPRGRKIRG
jgi:hypothetical protein